jgi:hypothetical protein
MTLWHTSYDLRLTAGGLASATVAKSLCLEAEASREALMLDTSLGYRDIGG